MRRPRQASVQYIFVRTERYLLLRHEKKLDDSSVAISVAFVFELVNSICNPEMGIARIRGLEDYCLLSKVDILNRCRQTGLHLTFPEGKPLGSHWIG